MSFPDCYVLSAVGVLILALTNFLYGDQKEDANSASSVTKSRTAVLVLLCAWGASGLLFAFAAILAWTAGRTNYLVYGNFLVGTLLLGKFIRSFVLINA